MEIRHGWSGETQPGRWAKFAVTLQEEDLRRMLGAGHESLRNLSTGRAFQLLELEAERLILVKLVTRYGYDPADGKTSIDDLETRKRALILEIRSAGR